MLLLQLNCYLENVDLILKSTLSFQSHLNPQTVILRFDCDRSVNDKFVLSRDLSFAKVKFHLKRLKTLENGGAWTHRYLSQSLVYNYDWLLQIEPESFCNSSFELPLTAGVYSNLLQNNDRFFLNGGAILFHRSSILTILDSGYLLDSRYTTSRWSYSGNKTYFHNSRIACQDAILYDTIARLGIFLKNFPAFSCYPHFFKHLVDPLAPVVHPSN